MTEFGGYVAMGNMCVAMVTESAVGIRSGPGRFKSHQLHAVPERQSP